MDLTRLSAVEIAARIRDRLVSSNEVVDAHLDCIARHNREVNAVVRGNGKEALLFARAADTALARGESWGPLHGVPFTLGDRHAAAGLGASIGTRESGYNPDRDGVVAERLRAAGGILLGKTNTSPALLAENTEFGGARNPYNFARSAGGASGGSAAAVAAGFSPLDVATDLLGSVRVPAHFCGVFGLRPTIHRVPMAGAVDGPPGTPRLDRLFGTVGIVARAPADLRLALAVLAGADPRDPEVPPVPVAAAAALELGELRIAVLPPIPGLRMANEIEIGLQRLAEFLARAGARVEHHEPFTFEAMWSAFENYVPAFLSVAARTKFPPPSPRQEAAAPPTPFELTVLADERDTFIAAYESFMTGYDVIMCPAGNVTAFPHRARGETASPAPLEVDGITVASSHFDRVSALATYVGAPAIVLPFGLDSKGMPIGAQLVGHRWEDERLIAVAEAIARATGAIAAPVMATAQSAAGGR